MCIVVASTFRCFLTQILVYKNIVKTYNKLNQVNMYVTQFQPESYHSLVRGMRVLAMK